jgi:hypothetical protein
LLTLQFQLHLAVFFILFHDCFLELEYLLITLGLLFFHGCVLFLDLSEQEQDVVHAVVGFGFSPFVGLSAFEAACLDFWARHNVFWF